jgi:hypothetical protein
MLIKRKKCLSRRDSPDDNLLISPKSAFHGATPRLVQDTAMGLVVPHEWHTSRPKHRAATERDRGNAAVKLCAIMQALCELHEEEGTCEPLMKLLQRVHPKDCIEAVDAMISMIAAEPNYSSLQGHVIMARVIIQDVGALKKRYRISTMWAERASRVPTLNANGYHPLCHMEYRMPGLMQAFGSALLPIAQKVRTQQQERRQQQEEYESEEDPGAIQNISEFVPL